MGSETLGIESDFPIGNGTSAKVEAALGVALGLHPFGDGFPVVDFGLIHGEQIKKSPEPLRNGDHQLSGCSSALRASDLKNPALGTEVRMTVIPRNDVDHEVGVDPVDDVGIHTSHLERRWNRHRPHSVHPRRHGRSCSGRRFET